MKIGILTHGENCFGRHYAREFLKRGHQVVLYSLTFAVSEEDYRGCEIHRLSKRTPPEGVVGKFGYIKDVWGLRRAIRQSRPDLLFALYLSSAGVVALLSGFHPMVLSARGGDVNAHIDSRLWRGVFRWQQAKAARIHTVSTPLADLLVRRAGLDAAKVITAPVGVDTSVFSYMAPEDRPGTGRIICTRAHKPHYGQDTLVRAMARLRDKGITFRVLFAAGDHEPTLEMVRQQGLENLAEFLGGYALKELPGLLRASDIYVSPSHTDGTSSSLLEAMSTGLFPVVSDIEANRPWVKHGQNGLLFPPRDDEAMARCLEQALADRDLRAKAAPLNRQIVLERGDVKVQMDLLLAAFERCVADSKR
jgi:glycosyltransferase involved in cell wall biosynthesis